jgi:serine/threonine protein kinase
MNTHFKELQAGATLQNGTYVIERTIGAGGFGITYAVKHTRLHVAYAIKEFFINGYCVRDMRDKTVQLQGIDPSMYEKYRQKFMEEAQTLARLDHPNVVRVMDVFTENNTAYMVMPFVEGFTLQQVVERHGTLSYDTAVNYIAQVAEAIGYVHQKNILHRDIKPDNIIITPDNKAVLIDFGSAREFVHDKTQSHTSILTQGYAPLEQYTANSRKGAYSDIYSLGAVFYFALTGQKPMDAATRTMESLPEPRALLPAIPDAANRTILKAMQLKPEERYQTVQGFMGDLLEVTVKEQMEEIPKKKRTWRFVKITMLVLIAAGVGTSIYFLMLSPWFERITTVSVKHGFIDKTGKEVIPCKYDGASSFSEGFACVARDGKYGLIDKTGKEVIPCKYDDADPFSNGLACVARDGQYGFIDKTGNVVIPCKYDGASSFSEGLARVNRDAKWGFINKTGKEVIPCKYDGASSFSEGLARVNRDAKWGIINKTGKEVIPCKYDYSDYMLMVFSDGLARVARDGKYGFIDKTGKEVIPCKYDGAYSFSEGLARVKRDGKYGFIDKTGKEVTPCKYDEAPYFSDGFAVVKRRRWKIWLF